MAQNNTYTPSTGVIVSNASNLQDMLEASSLPLPIPPPRAALQAFSDMEHDSEEKYSNVYIGIYYGPNSDRLSIYPLREYAKFQKGESA